MAEALVQTLCHGKPQTIIALVYLDGPNGPRQTIRIRELGHEKLEEPSFAQEPTLYFDRVHSIPDSSEVVFIRQRLEQPWGLTTDGLFLLDLGRRPFTPVAAKFNLPDRWWVSRVVHVESSRSVYCEFGAGPDPWLGGPVYYYLAELNLETGQFVILDQLKHTFF